MAVQLNGSAKT